jgi:hypothetical protein
MALQPSPSSRLREKWDALVEWEDRMLAFANEAAAEADRLRPELDAYKRAKAENDERFMIERDTARADLERVTRERASARRQLEAVDEALPRWEPAPGCAVGAVGRVQTIINLVSARERETQLREALVKIAAAAPEAHALRAFGDGCVGPTRKQVVRGSQPTEYREVVACPACYASAVLAGLPSAPADDSPQQDSLFEYGIALRDDMTDLHRSGMTDDEAQDWMRDWVQMSGRPWPFKIARRPLGEWEVVS